MNSHPCPSRYPATVSKAIATTRTPDPARMLRFRFSFCSSKSGAFSSVIVPILHPASLDTESARPGPADSASRSPPSKRRRKDLELGSRANQVDGNHVEPHRNGRSLRRGKCPQIGFRQAAQHPAFVFVHGQLCWAHVMRRARLHLDRSEERRVGKE